MANQRKEIGRVWYIGVILALIIQIVFYLWFTRYWK